MPGTKQTFKNRTYPYFNYLSLTPAPIRNFYTVRAYKFYQEYFQNCHSLDTNDGQQNLDSHWQSGNCKVRFIPFFPSLQKRMPTPLSIGYFVNTM